MKKMSFPDVPCFKAQVFCFFVTKKQIFSSRTSEFSDVHSKIQIPCEVKLLTEELLSRCPATKVLLMCTKC